VSLFFSNFLNSNSLLKKKYFYFHSLSLAGAFSDALNRMVSDTISAGIHVVTSAGDTASNACNLSPASASQAITVGAIDKATNNVLSTSNKGSCVDIYAPGKDIIAAGIGDATNSLSKASGTSQSCPHVSGTIALIISKQGNSSPSSMANTLINLSTKDVLTNVSPNRFLRVPNP
jgi:subtilisin family serine protease